MTCQAFGDVCGVQADGCGDMVDCGPCASPLCESLGNICGDHTDAQGMPLHCGTCELTTGWG
ncbi:MAG: hypothetical protein K0V04_05140 [Deltaproteobacteria bacterium]|nr:hypothetical protein [Deltaproteobacteria bacterium]